MYTHTLYTQTHSHTHSLKHRRRFSLQASSSMLLSQQEKVRYDRWTKADLVWEARLQNVLFIWDCVCVFLHICVGLWCDSWWLKAQALSHTSVGEQQWEINANCAQMLHLPALQMWKSWCTMTCIYSYSLSVCIFICTSNVVGSLCKRSWFILFILYVMRFNQFLIHFVFDLQLKKAQMKVGCKNLSSNQLSFL